MGVTFLQRKGRGTTFDGILSFQVRSQNHRVVCHRVVCSRLTLKQGPIRMAADTLKITGLYRYPVKGLSPEALEQVELSPGGTFPHDRRYAIENGPSGFDEAAPR